MTFDALNYNRCSTCKRPMVQIDTITGDKMWKHWAPKVDGDHAATLELTLEELVETWR